MWEWWGAYYNKALSLGVEFKPNFTQIDAKQYVKDNMQWGW